MNSRAVTTEYRLSQWARAMQDMSANGESIDEFCERLGISRNKYFYWQRKLREAACRQIAECPETAKQSGLTTAGFTEVKLARPALLMPEQEDRLCAEIGGVRLTVGSEYPPDKLAALLRELIRL